MYIGCQTPILGLQPHEDCPYASGIVCLCVFLCDSVSVCVSVCLCLCVFMCLGASLRLCLRLCLRLRQRRQRLVCVCVSAFGGCDCVCVRGRFVSSYVLCLRLCLYLFPCVLLPMPVSMSVPACSYARKLARYFLSRTHGSRRVVELADYY